MSDRISETALTEWLLRGFALIACGLAVSNLASSWWADTSRLTILILLLSEFYTLTLVLIARRATVRDLSPIAVIATTYALFFVVLLSADGTQRLVPEALGVATQVVGISWQVASKVTLGRSFGLLPARRGIVVAGPYRVVRHPIYLGYLIGHVGFLAVNCSLRNLVVLGVFYAAQVIRIVREERLLCASAEYLEYRGRVRWRLVPGVF